MLLAGISMRVLFEKVKVPPGCSAFRAFSVNVRVVVLLTRSSMSMGLGPTLTSPAAEPWTSPFSADFAAAAGLVEGLVGPCEQFAIKSDVVLVREWKPGGKGGALS